ncbi:MAG: GHMP kinase [Bacteroidales bacterium]
MIITKTPFRISFTGGGTDFAEFYQQEGGAVLSTTIDKYVYLSMHPLFNKSGYHLKYYENEIVDSVQKIRHPIIREVFMKYGITGVDFNSSSDVPSGTGLGSSSSFTVGLLNLVSNYKNKPLNKYELAEHAYKIEAEDLELPVGKQDQVAAAIGGINFIKFNTDDSVDIQVLNFDKKQVLEDSLILFYLGTTRESSFVLADQKKRTPQNIHTLRMMVKLTEHLNRLLNNNCLDNFGEILHEGWMYKKELSPNVTNGAIDFWYKKALDNGAKGGKILGAGNGGFLLLYVPDGKEMLRANMRLYELPFKFENEGTQIIYHD